jgi:sec-independent protein translocase protein TatB|tara:strand:+ start:869 stop:1105 length:237 start_codon:yes stop_codon:yes gene_type:complete
MPQIGWFEILVIVVLAVLIIGPKDFPVVVRKIGSWIGSVKRYFNEIQKDVTDIGDSVEKEISFDDSFIKSTEETKKDE